MRMRMSRAGPTAPGTRSVPRIYLCTNKSRRTNIQTQAISNTNSNTADTPSGPASPCQPWRARRPRGPSQGVARTRRCSRRGSPLPVLPLLQNIVRESKCTHVGPGEVLDISTHAPSIASGGAVMRAVHAAYSSRTASSTSVENTQCVNKQQVGSVTVYKPASL
jgi:hypothetical protein